MRKSSSPLRGACGLILLAGAMTVAGHPGFSAPILRPRPIREEPIRDPLKPGDPTPPTGPDRPQPNPNPEASGPAVPPPGNKIMDVSEVRPGMKGYGLTVFQGTKIERFGVEVLGVMPKQNMGEPLVLVRLSGGPISKRGAFLIQGMSGSPIYIQGKLLGAFSMGNSWPKEALGMVTPIKNMMEALDPKLSETPAGDESAFDPSAPAKAAVDTATPAVAPGQGATTAFKPLALPVAVSGLSARNLDRVANLLRPFNMNVMQGPGSTEPGKFKAELVPGAAIGVALMTGDIDMTGIGTVTYRNGNKVLAFGHPMMQIGAAQFPMTTAFIYDVFPGFDVSFKMGSAGDTVGTLVQDRPFSIAGRLGPAPKMIPIECKVDDKETGRTRTFHVQTANHPMLVGQLVPIAIDQALYMMRPVPGDTVANVKLTVETEGAGTITRENSFYDPSAVDVRAVGEVMELMTLLSSNSFRRVPVKDVQVDVTYEAKRPTATIERVFLNQEKYQPGDDVEIGVVARPYRKDPIVLKTHVKIPESASNGRAILMVQGGSTRVNLTSLMSSGSPGSLTAAGPPPDASLRQVLKRFMDREHNNQIVSRVIFPTAAVNVSGQRLGQLPSTIVDVMRSSKTTGFRVERDEAKSLQDTQYLIDGLQTLPITIEKDNPLEKPRVGTGVTGTTSSPTSISSPVSSSTTTTLSTGDEGDDLSVFHFTVNGQPRMIRLTPEVGEDAEETPAAAADDDDGKPEKGDAGDKSDDGDKPAKNAKPEKPSRNSKRGDKNAKTAAPAPAPAAPARSTESTTPPDDKLVGRQATLWTQSTPADFGAGTLVNAGVATTGEVRLTPSLQLVDESSEQFVWSVVGVKGATYAGTGNGGLVLKVDPDKHPSTFFKTGELEVHALAKDSAGNIYAGTSPNGKVFKITPDGKGTELLAMNGTETAPDVSSKFVTALAVADDGTVYAGTGPNGNIYRIRPGQKADLLCSIPDKSVMSLYLAPNGNLYAGSAEEGTIYKIGTADGKCSVLFDTDQPVVSGLAMDLKGTLYAACSPSGEIFKIEADGTPRSYFNRVKGAVFGLITDAGGNLYTAVGDSVIRIEPDGTAVVLTEKKKAQFTCLAWDDSGRIVAGSANVGSIYWLGPATSGSFESTVHDAKLPAQWGRIRFTATMPTGGGLKVQTRSGNTPTPDASWSEWQDPTSRENGMYVASPAARFLQYRVQFETTQGGTPALRDIAISYLPRNQAPKVTLATPNSGDIIKGTYALKWSALDPDKDTLTYKVAYSSDGGHTWKPVGESSKPAESSASASGSGSSSKSDDEGGRPSRASAEEALKRYREQLDKDSSLSQEQRDTNYNKAKSLVEKYLEDGPSSDKPANGGSPSSAAPSTAPAKQPGVTRQATLNWDTKQVPDGLYVIRVEATDQASNPGEPLEDMKISDPFIISNTAPQLFVFDKGVTWDAQKNATVVGFASGRVSLKGAQYRLGDGDWTAIEAEDGLWDSANEHFRFTIPNPGAGEQTLEVKTVDAAGNAQNAKLKLKAP